MAVSSRSRTGIVAAIAATVILIFVIAILLFWGAIGSDKRHELDSGPNPDQPELESFDSSDRV
ncbi:MAG: hypothetical protein HC927_11005 [Deltaproteobacteria bacterium]|nr:hypothetical protein [Deltaproteobacteria bacterium]